MTVPKPKGTAIHLYFYRYGDIKTPLKMPHTVVYHKFVKKSMGEFNYRMKKIISVKEFKDYCEENKPHSIIYQTENQKWYRVSDPCKVKMSFPIMLICENPNLICLKSGTNTLSFDRVKYVEVDTESTVLGTLFTVFCGDFKTNGHEITYTLIAA